MANCLPRHVGTSSSQGAAGDGDGDTNAGDIVDSVDAAAAINMDLEMQKLLVARRERRPGNGKTYIPPFKTGLDRRKIIDSKVRGWEGIC